MNHVRLPAIDEKQYKRRCKGNSRAALKRRPRRSTRLGPVR